METHLDTSETKPKSDQKYYALINKNNASAEVHLSLIFFLVIMPVDKMLKITRREKLTVLIFVRSKLHTQCNKV